MASIDRDPDISTLWRPTFEHDAVEHAATEEQVLRALLDDSHARLRELQRSLQKLKDFLTL
jgi:hypothetical protein